MFGVPTLKLYRNRVLCALMDMLIIIYREKAMKQIEESGKNAEQAREEVLKARVDAVRNISHVKTQPKVPLSLYFMHT